MKPAAVLVTATLLAGCTAGDPPGLRSRHYELPTDEYNPANR